jgi:hypothetical protein
MRDIFGPDLIFDAIFRSSDNRILTYCCSMALSFLLSLDHRSDAAT